MSGAMIDTVLFDLGNVLIRWDPRNYYRSVFKDDSAGMEDFLANVCSPEWNHQMDMGKPYDEAIAELKEKWPDKVKLIEAWKTHWPEMLDGAIEENVEVLTALKKNGYALYALTNWSAENFHIAEERFQFLSCFRDIIVSGREGMAKPDPDFFKLAIRRFNIDSTRTVFIDDTAANIETARALEMTTLHVLPTTRLAEKLRGLGLNV